MNTSEQVLRNLLSLGKIFAKALIFRIILVTKVTVVIANLEVKAENCRETVEIFLVIAKKLHETNGEHEEATRLTDSHKLVISLGWTLKIVAPVNFHTLSAMQFQKLFIVDLCCLGKRKIIVVHFFVSILEKRIIALGSEMTAQEL